MPPQPPIQKAIREACESGEARIGVKRFRDQAGVLAALKVLGYRKPWLGEARQFIRDTVTRNPNAFDSLASTICIHTVHEGREWFWDGSGNLRDAHFYNDAEIMYDLQMNNERFKGILPGL